VCGLEFERSEPRAPQADLAESALMSVGRAALYVLLIIGVLLLVGLGVVFATCSFGQHGM
jgi:hypothetical protein